MICELLAHESFLQRVSEFRKVFPSGADSKALIAALRKSRDDPTNTKQLEGIISPELQGKLYRLHVGGRKGQRYIYLFEPQIQKVFPIWLSLENKSDHFDYPFSEIEQIASRLAEDYAHNSAKNFRILNV